MPTKPAGTVTKPRNMMIKDKLLSPVGPWTPEPPSPPEPPRALEGGNPVNSVTDSDIH